MIALDPTGLPVEVGRVRLRTPGLSGHAEAHPPASDGMRAAELSTPGLDAALANAFVEPQVTIEIRDTTEVPGTAIESRSTAYDEPAIEVEVPDAGPDYGQFLLYQDEAGVVTWTFPVGERDQADTSRGFGVRRYVLRRHVPPPADSGEHRGLFGAAGSKLIKVLAFKLLDPVAGMIGRHFARRWEEAKRPYIVRTFTSENYATVGTPLTRNHWDRLRAHRSLLMIHGTISRTDMAFGSLRRETVQALSYSYGDRIFAFDHFTLSEDPLQNLRRFIELAPDDVDLEMDIVCHSRGGLVARQLAERQAALSAGARRIRIKRIVFVAVPNAGTPLADVDHMSDFIDSYTNLLNFLPDNGVTDTLEGIITIAKLIAHGTVQGLSGLQSMHPDGPYLRTLNSGERDDKKYFSISSNYEPAEAGWKMWVANRLLDRVFKGKNDLVVPMESVYAANGSGFFPIASNLHFDGNDGVAHTRFFRQAKVQEQLLAWLNRTDG